MKIVIAKRVVENWNLNKNAFEFLRQYKNDKSVYLNVSDKDRLNIDPRNRDLNFPIAIHGWNVYESWRHYKFYEKRTLDLPGIEDQSWKYINIFRIKPDMNILDLGTMDTHEYKKLEKEVHKMFGQISYSTEIFKKTIHKPGGIRIWRLTHRLASHHSKKTNVAWNKIWRDLGYEGLTDSAGIILNPYKLLIFNSKYLKHMETFSKDGSILSREAA